MALCKWLEFTSALLDPKMRLCSWWALYYDLKMNLQYWGGMGI